MPDSSPETTPSTRPRRRPGPGAVAAVAVLGLLAAGGYWAADRARPGDAADQPVPLGRTAPIALTTATDCAQLLARFKADGARLVGPYGLNGSPIEMFSGGVADQARTGVQPPVPAAAGAQPGEQAASSSSSSSSSSGAPDSTTNVQVAGVDESDIVKTSGDVMVSVVDGRVRVTRLAGARTRELGSWRPPGEASQIRDVLLEGGQAVVLADSYPTSPFASDLSGGTADSTRSMPLPQDPARGPSDRLVPVVPGPPGVDLYRLDLSDPGKPRLVQRLSIEGQRAGSARLVDGELRLAVNAGPGGFRWRAGSAAANRKLVQRSTLKNWLPTATVTTFGADGAATSTQRRQLLDCHQVSMPATFSGLATLAMVSLDLRAADPLGAWRAAGVIAAGGTLYATADHAWLAAQRWAPVPVRAVGVPAPGGVAPEDSGSLTTSVAPDDIRFAPVPATTQLYRFDTPARSAPKYVASGQIPGTLLNQFALDEQAGLLRVASTTGDGASNAGSAARVTVLRTAGDELVQVGKLTGLGRGEQIKGIRFAGDLGYVVTFRQTDPLFVVDLSDPAHPALRGELKLPGYSAYLHPLGPGRLLGLGQDGTAAGQTTGLQLSLFDVSDPAAPARLDRVRVKGAWSDVESDHHAFTVAGDLVLVPYSGSVGGKGPDKATFDAGVIAVRVSAGGLDTGAVLRPIADGPVTYRYDRTGTLQERILGATPMRTVVHAGSVYTLTPAGVAVHDATTFARSAFARF